MASLRYGTDNAPSAEWQAALDEQNRPNALRGGWESGRIGTDRNALGIDESAARAAGDTEKADDLRRQNDALAQAQGRVAPRVGRVEDINGVGDALNWAAGQMGQGVASMVEPVAAATTIGGAGALLSLMPGPLGRVGKGLRNFGAPAAAYGINQRQLAGEFYNDAVQDPELMARTSAQDLNRTANAYGAVAGGLDTVAPAIIGRQLTGAGLRAGTKAMGPGLKTLLGATGEGVTELAQNYGSQQTQGFLNPDRDTSGDFMENVNAAAGGFAGGGPLSAAGAYTDAAFRRTGAAGETIAARAGDMYDLAQETGGRAAEGARDLAGQAAARAGEIRDLAQEQYQGSALQGGVDRAVEAGKAGLAAGKQKAGDLIDLARGDDGQISLERLAEAAEQGVGRAKEAVGGAAEGVQDLAQRFKLSSKELEMLDMVPPPGIAEGPGYDAWANQASIERDSFVALRLQEMAETDPVAAELFERAGNEQDPVAQFDIFEEAAEYLRQNSEITQVQAAANQYAENAGKVGAAVGRGALAAGKAAAGFGKALFDSAKAGARKQNLQGDAPASGFSAWRARTMPDAPAMQEQDVRRADMYGDILAAGVRANAKQAGIGEKRIENMQGFLRDAGYRIANMAQSWKGEQGSKRPATAGQDMVLRELAGRMVSGLGRDADRALAEMQAIATPEAAPFFDRLRQSVVEGRTPLGRQKALSERNTVANELMLLLPEARRAEVMASEAKGGLLSRKWLLDSAEKLHNGHESPEFRKAFEEAFGKDLVAQMMDHISPTAMKSAGKYGTAQDNATYATEDALTEDGEFVADGEATGMKDPEGDFEARQNEKMVRKGSAPKLYGFYKTKNQSVRSSDDRRDPFAPVSKLTKAEQERAASDAAESGRPVELSVTRPNMFNSSETGKRQLAEQIAQMEESVGPRYMVSGRSAKEVMADLGYEPAKVLSIYRDYLRQDAAREGTPLAQRKYLREQANLADRAILDAMEGLGAEKNGAQMSPTQLRAAEATQKRIAEYQAKQPGAQGVTARLNPAERNAVFAAADKYLSEHSVAVAEMVTNRDPGQMELGELVNFGRTGNKTWDFAMRGRSKEQGPDPQVVDDANLITFQSDVMGKTGEDRSLHIPASRLVGWVRAARPFDSAEESDKKSAKAVDKNEAFFKDLMEGITAIMDSGMVDPKLPTRMNAKGEWEAFGKTVPKSLQLETTTYGGMQFGRKQRAAENAAAADKARGVMREEREMRVQGEQAKDDWFVADPWEGVEEASLQLAPPTTESLTAEEKDARSRIKTAAEMRAFDAAFKMRESGEKFNVRGHDPDADREYDAPGRDYEGLARKAKIERSEGVAEDKENFPDPRAQALRNKTGERTPLDSFRRQKTGEVPDEYADQRYRSSTSRAVDGIGPEPKMSAMKRAEDRAAELSKVLNNDFSAGMERIESRMRTAGRPGYVAGDPNALVGGPHYIAPLAHALSVDNAAKFDGEERAYLDYRRAEVAEFILGSNLPVPQKIALTTAMVTRVDKAKVNTANFLGQLQAIAKSKAKGGVSPFDPTSAPKGVSAAMEAAEKDVSVKRRQVKYDPAAKKLADAKYVADMKAGKIGISERRITGQDDMLYGPEVDQSAFKRTQGSLPKAAKYVPPQTPKPGGKPEPLLKFMPKLSESISASTAPSLETAEKLLASLDKYEQFLNNPPMDYTTEQGVKVGEWVGRQAARIKEAVKLADDNEVSELLGVALDQTKRMAAKVSEMTAADKEIADLETASEVAPTPAPAPSQLQQTLDAHTEYLNNPPADYTTAKARAIADWAQRQLTRLDAAMAGVDETSERYETLFGTRLSARLLAKKAASVLEGDESLANIEGPASRAALELPGARATVAEGDYAALDAALAAISKGSGEGMSNADLDAATKWAATQAKAIKKQMASMEEGDHRDALETIYDDLVGSLGQLGIPRSEVAKRISAAPEVASAGLPKGSASQRGGRDLGALPMHYKMPPHGVRQDLRAQYPNGTTTAQLMADGHRTATTRRAFGAVGDTFTVAGREYRITALERVDMDSAAGREKWAQREGWDVDYIQQHGSGQVRTGAVQTVFERVGAVNVWHSTGENAQLSNLAARPFTLGGKQFHSVEHAYQSWKSGEFDQGTYDRYTGAGRKIAGTKGTKIGGGWNLRMMKRLMEESFRQNPDAAQALLATGDAPITHTQDKGVWAKEFPRILSEVRAELAPKTDLWSDTGGRKLNRQASEIHNDLKRSGFAATHDSPIRHEGKFNWREHIGKGEGNAAFGAGTYLSTADGVHASYKDQFSQHHSEGDPALEANHRKLLISADVAMMKFGKKSPEYVAAEAARAAAELEYLGTVVRTTDASPTYQVSVNIKPEELLDWDAHYSEQSAYVKERLDAAEAVIPGIFVNELTGEAMYEAAARELGSQAKASEYLQSLGILGHRYAASGGKNDTHPNYVIYDDSKITTNYVHFSKQGGNARTVTDAEMKEAKDYVKKVLGPQVKVTFKDITGYAGEWIDAEQAMEISTTTAAGAMQTAYHEALHGFFSKFVKSDPRVLEVMKSLAGNEKIMARVQALLAKHPAALQQLSSGEERLAYIYQFWASGQLNLPIGQPRTLLQKVRKFFRAILGLVKDSERAAALLEAFHGGKLAEPSAAGRVIAKTLDEGTVPLKLRRSMDGIAQWTASRVMPSESILATSDSAAAKALGKEFFSNPGAGAKGQAAKGEGYLNARRHAASKYNNRRAALLKDLSENDMAAVMKHMQAETEVADIDFAPHREAVKGLRTLLQRFYRYMKDERGVEIDHAGEKYFPRVWNVSALVGQQQEFTDMLLQKYPAQMTEGARNGLTEADVAQRIWRNLVDRQGVSEAIAAQREDGVLSPFFASKETRTLSWLQGEHIEPFLEKNLVATLSQYFHQGARAAEYTSRFGKDGKDLERRLTQVNNELTEASFLRMKRGEFKDNKARAEWARRQFRDVSEAVGAMEGTLGKDVSPKLRKANSWMTVYQNVRLLPLSLFASFVDPMGMVARGAPMREAYDGFLRGMKEVFGTWGDMLREEPKERQADEWEQLAQHIGAVDAAVFSNFVADEYSSVYMEKGAKKINDTMFKLNGMEAWNRGMRVAGVKSAVKFIERHAANPEHHSARWIDELGLAMDKVPFDSTGKLITDKHVLMNEKGISKAQAERDIERVHTAINRWVEGAILTPNAAQRPAWSSDPHYSIFFHLKQFSYSFHQTIMKRAVKELNYGNLAPLGAFAWYIPVMIGADIVKGLIQGGGDLPNYMKGYDAGDWFWHGVNRSGTLGIGALGVGAFDDPGSILGPAPEQVLDAMTDPLAKTTLRALPGNSLYRQAFV